VRIDREENVQDRDAHDEKDQQDEILAQLSELNKENFRWTQFNQKALHSALVKEAPENRRELMEEFQEKYNQGITYYLSFYLKSFSVSVNLSGA
jgi:hypothetical protein